MSRPARREVHNAVEFTRTGAIHVQNCVPDYPDGLLEKLLADPSMVPRSSTYGLFTMPDLQLQQAEIAALVAFINAPRTAAAGVPAR
jgi:hypothetical protein